MRKMFMFTGALVSAVILSGCMTGGSHDEAEANYKKFKSERPELVVVKSGDTNLDNTAALSAKVYGSTVKYLDEYIAAVDNHREYRGFLNDVDAMVKKEGINENKAMDKILSGIVDPALKQKVLEGKKAVEALKPENKLKELAPLAVEAAGVSNNAAKLPASFKGFDANTLAKARTATNVANQAKYTVEALAFLKRQYEMTKEAKNHMKDADQAED